MRYERTFFDVPGYLITQTLPDSHSFKLGNFKKVKQELK
jgi:hypothetical protein